ncbi:ANKRD50 [Symbiodinium sp. CCMP2456]|nr:ANKRD50 [Symbiodinium sp. CCMP2456]
MASKSWAVRVTSFSGEEVGSYEVPPFPAGLQTLTFKIAGQKGISSQQVTLLHENMALTRWSALAEAPDVLQLVVVPPAHAAQRQAAAELLSQLENSRPYPATINQIARTEWSVLGLTTDLVLAKTLDSTIRYKSEYIVGMLLEQRAAVNRPEGTAQPLHSAVMLNHLPTVRLLLRAAADTNCTDDDSKSALHLAAAGGSSVVARLLLENRAIINRPEDTETPLHSAAAVRHLETVSILLEAQAQVNRTGRAERTALHCAAVAGAGPVVSALVAARAEIHRQDRNRKVALQYAVSSDDVLSVDVLLSAGAAGAELKIRGRVPVLHYALSASTEAMVEHVLRRRADLDATDPKGRLPFLLAAARSDSGFIKLLCKWKPLDAEDMDRALCVAAEKGNSSVVQFLLQRRANPSSRTEETTCLHLAAAGGYEVVIRELLHAKADANCKDSKSRIPWKVCKGKSLAELLKPSR